MKNLIFSIIILLVSIPTYAQVEITPVNSNFFESSIRGLYRVDDNVIWASGTEGVIMRTINNKDWETFYNPKFTSLDFRDIHAFNENEAIIMSSGKGCELYRTEDGGTNWIKVYENKQEGIFFDGMDFWDDKSGIAFSDPINGKIFLIETKDGGKTWLELKPDNMPKVLDGEAGFAASGTGINCLGKNTVFIATGGGKISRVFKSIDRGRNWKVYNTPLRSGEGSGIYSMSMKSEKEGVIVGGNYLDSANTKAICAYTLDGGQTWKLSEKQPYGYRSCVTVYNDYFICCGRNGIDVSYDKGNKWKHISDDAYYSCVLNKNHGWLFGKKGKMAKIEIKP